MAFSIFKNFKNLCNLQREKSQENTKYLSGIKVLSYFGIFVIHSISTKINFPLQNPFDADNFIKSKLGLAILKFADCLDIFFLISGLVLTKSILKDLNR